MKLTSRGINVLGSPVGNGDFTHDFVMDKVHKNQELLREIEALAAHDNAAAAQSALLLLRYCAVPAVTHLLRTAPPALAYEAFVGHERNILGTVSKLISPTDPLFRDLTDADARDDYSRQHQRLARLQVQLSLKEGGCGIASTVMTAPLAYIAAWRSCLSFLDAHGGLFPSVSGLVSSDALAAADGGLVASDDAGPLDFLAQSWDMATLIVESPDVTGEPAMRTALGAEVTGIAQLARAQSDAQRRLTAALHVAQRKKMLLVRSASSARP